MNDAGYASSGKKTPNDDLPLEKKHMGFKALETKQLLLAFLASTEYRKFMEFMMDYIAEQEEDDEFHHHNDQTGEFHDHDHDEGNEGKTEEEIEWGKLKEC